MLRMLRTRGGEGEKRTEEDERRGLGDEGWQ